METELLRRGVVGVHTSGEAKGPKRVMKALRAEISAAGLD